MRTTGRPARRGLFRRKPKGAIEGKVRVDRRTKNLLLRVRAGEIAVIVHDDLDQVSAEGLVERSVAAVINCGRSITGRYPNAGPLELARAGIPLIDDVGEDLLDHIAEGDRVQLLDGEISVRGEVVAKGVVLAGDALEHALARAHEGMAVELERFVRNTMDYLIAERDLVLRGGNAPTLRTEIAGRHVVVVVRGNEHRKDLQTLRPYLREEKPVLIAVDGAADAMLEEGLRPDIIIGDMDSVSATALACGAELVVHAYPDGTAPGLERIEGLGLEAAVYASAGTSEDIALLLAYESRADLIVAVGAHDNLVEFLDKGRGGMASTFVTRLKVGPKLVDAKGVNRLYRSRVSTTDLVVLVGAALAAMVVATFVSPGLRLAFRYAIDWIGSLF